jgi:hypothetical protein
MGNKVEIQQKKHTFAIKNVKTGHFHDRSTSNYSSRHHRVRDCIHHHDAGAECQCKEDYLYQHNAGGEPKHIAQTEQDARLRT